MQYTTLRAIKQQGPCKRGFRKLIANLGKKKIDDEPLSFLKILESNGLQDAVWCLRATEDCYVYERCVLFGLWCAKLVQPHMSKDALLSFRVAKRYFEKRICRNWKRLKKRIENSEKWIHKYAIDFENMNGAEYAGHASPLLIDDGFYVVDSIVHFSILNVNVNFEDIRQKQTEKFIEIFCTGE